MDNYMPYNQMMNPYLRNANVMGAQTEKLEDMYPDIYHRVFPKVQQMCMLKDTSDNPEMYPQPSREMVESMTDDIYRDTMMEMGETEEGPEMEGQRQFGIYGGPGFGGYPGYGGYPGFGYPGYGYPGYGYPGYCFGRRRPIRDLIGILLIRELLRRRGVFY